MQILAHRGASRDAPENTMEAFEEAIRQRADGVELDAMVCGSGEVVVCHDERLDRLAGLDWVVSATGLWKLRRADVGSKLGFATARIPLLADVLDRLPPELVINIELKCETVDDLGLTRKVVELVEERRMADRVVISSFNALCLFRLIELAPALRRGFLIDPDRSWAFQSQVLAPLTSSYSVHPYHEQCGAERVSGWRERGWQVMTWTVDEGVRAAELREMGVTHVITNRPGVIRDALQGRPEAGGQRPATALDSTRSDRIPGR